MPALPEQDVAHDNNTDVMPPADIAAEKPEGKVDKETYDPMWVSSPDNIPQNLKDLMKEKHVTEWDIQEVVAARGYYPGDMPIEKYDAGFIQGVLVGAWQKVYSMIKEMKEKMEIPFN